MPTDAQDLKVELAGLKGEVMSELKHQSHDIKNILQSLSAFVPRREIEQGNASTDMRIAKLENLVTWLMRTAAIFLLGGLATAWKAFLH